MMWKYLDYSFNTMKIPTLQKVCSFNVFFRWKFSICACVISPLLGQASWYKCQCGFPYVISPSHDSPDRWPSSMCPNTQHSTASWAPTPHRNDPPSWSLHSAPPIHHTWLALSSQGGGPAVGRYMSYSIDGIPPADQIGLDGCGQDLHRVNRSNNRKIYHMNVMNFELIDWLPHTFFVLCNSYRCVRKCQT